MAESIPDSKFNVPYTSSEGEVSEYLHKTRELRSQSRFSKNYYSSVDPIPNLPDVTATTQQQESHRQPTDTIADRLPYRTQKDDIQKTKSSSSSTDHAIADRIPHPPDGGYGWVIMMAAFMNSFIVDGIAFTFGIFMYDFKEYFELSTAEAALIGSINSGIYLLSAALVGALINKFGCRPVSFGGSIVATIGFVFCTLSPNYGVMIVTYGIIAGLGLGHLFLPGIVAVSFYFQKRRALATGVAVCGSGVGCFVMAPLGKFLLDQYGWRGAMLIISGISLNGCVFAALLWPLEPPMAAKIRRMRNVHLAGKKKHVFLRPVFDMKSKILPKTHGRLVMHVDFRTDPMKPWTAPADKNPRHRYVPDNWFLLPTDINPDDLSRPLYRSDIFYSGSVLKIKEFRSHELVMNDYLMSVTSVKRIADTNQQNKKESGRCVPRHALHAFVQMTNITLFKEPLYVIIWIADTCAAFALFIPFVFISRRAQSYGIPPYKAAFLISIIGIFNTAGRVITGLISDCSCVNPLMLHNSALMIGGVICLLSVLCTDYVSLCIYAAIFGLCIATWTALTTIILCKLVGLQRLTNAFGLIVTGIGIATLIASPVAGVMYDRTHDYRVPFVFCGAMMLFSGLLCCLLLVLPRLHIVKSVPVPAQTSTETVESRGSKVKETVLKVTNVGDKEPLQRTLHPTIKV